MTFHCIPDMGPGSLHERRLAYDCVDAHPIYHGLWNETAVWILECPTPGMPTLIIGMEGCPKQVLEVIRKGNGARAYYTALLMDTEYFLECLNCTLNLASERGRADLRRQLKQLLAI